MKTRSIAVVALLASAGLPAAAQNVRTMDGAGNNLNDISMGAAGTMQTRATDALYAGTEGMRAGPNARAVSNAIGVQTATGNSAGLSAMFWQWGQFIDHDMVLTNGGGAFAPIFAPGGDPVFPAGAMIPFSRSAATIDGSGTPQYANQITSFLDASMVYGSDDLRASALRTYADGMLALDGGFMPLNTGGLDNANEGFMPDATMFLGGDVRANEQAGLTSLHTIFVREHNQWAERLAAENTGWTDEEIYQTARKIVGAEVQAITYNEWLPTMLGDGALGGYTGYDSSVDASISLEFSTAAFRFGHTMLNEELWRLNEDGTTFDGGNLTLHENFFNPAIITGDGALEALMRGMSAQEAEELDTQMIDGVRNMLFGDPGHGGMDLMAANLMRGRDHGIGTYNDIREAMGLIRVTEWSDVTSDAQLAEQLAALYGSTDELDAWVGLVAEDHLDGAIVGETLFAVLGDQFDRLRTGDRFFYLNDPDLDPWLSDIAGTTLGDVIARNTRIDGFDGSVFYATVPAPSSVGVLAIGGMMMTRRRRA